MADVDRKVTVGIPVYNEKRFIRKTLLSVLGQADEIIISDNASTDGTSEICRKFAEKYPKVQYIRYDENKGAWYNFTSLPEKAAHGYFMWLGGHDLLPNRHIKKLKRILDTEDVVLAYANAVHFNKDYVFQKVYEHDYADELLSDNPAERVFSIISKFVEGTMVHGVFKKSALIQSIYNVSHDQYCGWERGILGEIAYNGKMKLCDNTVYYRIYPHKKSKKTDQRTERVLRSLYGSMYNESMHTRDALWLGMAVIALRTAEKASSYSANKEQYVSSVKDMLLARFGHNDTRKKMMQEHFGIHRRERPCST